MAEQKNKDSNNSIAKGPAAHCGIIMPIAAMGSYEAIHWARVRDVLDAAIKAAGFTPRMVSEGEEITVIHANIVQNLYNDEIVVCDVSGKNANVMFELGMRLAFDKPTIIVKDDDTDYSFDTSPIKHIGYRRDQRFDDVLNFQRSLTRAITATLEAKRTDNKYSPFLRHFKNITPKHIEHEEITQSEFIVRQLTQLQGAVERLSVDKRLLRDDEQLWKETVQSKSRRYQWGGKVLNLATMPPADQVAFEKILDLIISEATDVEGRLYGNKDVLRHNARLSVQSANLDNERFDHLFDIALDMVSRREKVQSS